MAEALAACEWKPEPIKYVMEKLYHPDAKLGNIYIELKGRFRTTDEAKKYIWIREHLPEGHELVFIFSNPRGPMPRARRRKDGTTRTHADWADEHGFTWYAATEIPASYGRTYAKRPRKKVIR